MFGLEVSPIVGSSASFIFSNVFDLDIFFVLCLGSILLIGDSGLLSMFRSIFGLCWLTLGSILVTCMDDLDGF